MLEPLRYTTTIFDIILFLILAFFMRSLNYSDKKDRGAIYGFAWMMVVVLMNVACIWV